MAKTVRKSASASTKKNTKPKAPAAGRVKKAAAIKKAMPAAPAAIPAPVPDQTEVQISMKSSKRFWVATLGVLAVAAALVQWIGYNTGWGDPERLVQRYLTQGQKLTLAKRYDAAISQYEKILKLKTSAENVRQALIAMADLQRERQNYEESIRIYSQLRGNDATSVLAAWASLQIGDVQWQAAQYDQAIQTYAGISRDFPKSDWDAEARLGLGKSLEKQEKYKDAIAAYEALTRDYAGGFLAAEALVHVGQCYEFLGDLTAARRAYQMIIDKYPSTTWDDAKARLARLDAGKPGEGVRTWGQSE